MGTRELEQGAEMFVRRGSCEVCEGKEICHDAYIGGGGQHQGWTSGPCQNVLICENMDNFMGGDLWHLMASKMKAHK